MIVQYSKKIIKQRIKEKYGSFKAFIEYLISDQQNLMEENYFDDKNLEKIYNNLKVNLSPKRKISKQWLNIFNKLNIITINEIKTINDLFQEKERWKKLYFQCQEKCRERTLNQSKRILKRR